MSDKKIRESADSSSLYHKATFRNNPQSRTAVLMIHGILGSPDHFKPFLDLVPSTWTIHNILLSGHGGSVSDFAHSSMNVWKQQVLDEIDELCCVHDKIMIAGHSMGTLLALYALKQRPDVIKQLFFLNVPLYITLKYPAIVHSIMSIFHCFPSHDLPALAARDACSIRLTPKLWQYVGWIPRYAELFREAALHRDQISSIEIPCWIFQSKRDALVSSRSEKLLRNNPHIQLNVLSKSGHYYYAPEDLLQVCAAFENACRMLERNTHFK